MANSEILPDPIEAVYQTALSARASMLVLRQTFGIGELVAQPEPPASPGLEKGLRIYAEEHLDEIVAGINGFHELGNIIDYEQDRLSRVQLFRRTGLAAMQALRSRENAKVDELLDGRYIRAATIPGYSGVAIGRSSSTMSSMVGGITGVAPAVVSGQYDSADATRGVLTLVQPATEVQLSKQEILHNHLLAKRYNGHDQISQVRWLVYLFKPGSQQRLNKLELVR